MRASGILLPVSSLPSPYGIGCFSKEAYEFIDQLAEAGQKYWQILPLGPTGYGDSPYQSFSTYAGNPYFIDLRQLIEAGILKKAECDRADFGGNAECIDYEKLYLTRYQLMRTAYERSNVKDDEDFHRFQQEEAYWLKDYALFMAVKRHFQDVCWTEWPEDIRLRYGYALDYYRTELYYEIEFQEYVQYLFAGQWRKLKAYANAAGVQIIGDIPIYVSYDSSDVWSHPELFQLDENRMPTAVAGCPPDGFSATGQLWGNPLYAWECHEQTGYQWWISRICYCTRLYDVVRIDHFRGFDQYFSIPFGDETAEHGHWEQGPGMKLFDRLKECAGEVNIIAEDLGFLTDSVKKLVEDSGFPGMKVLEFAFDSREESDYLPHTYPRNCVVYTGTHDNETIAGWYQKLPKEDLQLVWDYMDNQFAAPEKIHWDFIRLAMLSVADTCIIPLQDYLGLGHEARINTPSTLGDNWKWRMKKGMFTKKLMGQIRKLTAVSGRGR